MKNKINSISHDCIAKQRALSIAKLLAKFSYAELVNKNATFAKEYVLYGVRMPLENLEKFAVILNLQVPGTAEYCFELLKGKK